MSLSPHLTTCPDKPISKAHLRYVITNYFFILKYVSTTIPVSTINFSYLNLAQSNQLINQFFNSLPFAKTLSQQIQYINRMITQFSLSDAVSKLYGKTLIPCGSPMTQWQLFSPYSIPGSESKLLLKLLEVPAHLWTSQQICHKTIEKFKGLLHEVKLIFIERCFQSSYYLLAAKDNLIPVSSILKIKRQAGEKVDESLIYDYLQFTNRLQKSPYSSQIQFDENSIGINQQGKFVLANYNFYFEDHQRFSIEKQRNLSQPNCGHPKLMRDMRMVLAKLLMADKQKIDIMELYQSAESYYGKDMVNIVQKVMEPSCDVNEIASIIGSLKTSRADESFSATITDTCVEDCEKISENFMNQSYNTLAIDQSFKKIKKYKASLKRKKIGAFIIVFLIILLGIGAITFKYLAPRPLRCQQNQYPSPELQSCLSCDFSCERCSGSGSLMCTSCKGNLYLLMKSIADKTGRCSEDCKGTIIKTKICIDNH